MPAGSPWVNLPMVEAVSDSAASCAALTAAADADAADLVVAGHDDLHQAVARFAAHFGDGQLGLCFFHVFLHFLSLLHQAAQSCFSEHRGYSCGWWFKKEKDGAAPFDATFFISLKRCFQTA